VSEFWGPALLFVGLFAVAAYTGSWIGCLVSAGMLAFLWWAHR
jgi:hypothetical protein